MAEQNKDGKVPLDKGQRQLTPKEMDELRDKAMKAWYVQMEAAIVLFLSKLMLEMQQHGRRFQQNEPLPVAVEALKVELRQLLEQIQGPQIVKPSTNITQ
jgi:hypothetical protein